MFDWLKLANKGIDLTKVIFSFIDDSEFTPEEKAQKKSEILKLNLDKLNIKAGVLLKALKIGYSDSVSGNKFQSYARPAVIWLFVVMIFLSIPLGFLNYYNNDVFLAFVDGMRIYLSALPDSLIYGFFGVIGVYKVARTIEKKAKIDKDIL